MVCSGRGDYIAALDESNLLQIWQLPQGIPVASISLKSPVRQLFFSPDALRVVAVFKGFSAGLVDVLAGREIASVTHAKPINHCASSPDGTYFGTSSWDRTAKIWRVVDGKPVATMMHSNWVNGIAFHPDSSKVITACADYSAKLWNLPDTQPCTFLAHEKPVTKVSFSKDGRHLISASADRTAKVWNMPDGSLKHTLTAGNWLNDAIMSADGRFVVTTDSAKTAIIWDGRSGTLRARLPETDWIWEFSTGTVITTFRHEKKINSMAISPDGNTLAIAGDDSLIRLYDCRTPLLVSKSTSTFQLYEDIANAATGNKFIASGNMRRLSFEEQAGTKARVASMGQGSSPEALLWRVSKPDSGSD